MPHYTDWFGSFKANVRPQYQPQANDDIIGLDVGPVNKLADKGWWTVDGADFREPQKDSLTNVGKEGFTLEAASDIWTNGGASTFAEIEIDSMVLQDNGIGSEHWPELRPNCLPLAAPLHLWVLARIPCLTPWVAKAS